MVKKMYLLGLSVIAIATLAACAETTFTHTNDQVKAMSKANPSSNDQSSAFLQGNPTTIWYKLQQTSSPRLQEMLKSRTDPSDQGWIELALINKRYGSNGTIYQMPTQLIEWRAKYPEHPGNSLIPNDEQLQSLSALPPPQHLAILLPQTGSYSSASRKVREGILNAYYANASTGIKQNIKFYDTAQNPNLVELYQKATLDGADFVIGPLTKNEVKTIKMTGSFTAPVIALNFSDNASTPAHFYEFGLMPEDEAGMAAERAYQEGLTQAIVIAPNTEWGKRITQYFTHKWQGLGGSVKDTWLYQSRATFNDEVARLLKVDLQMDKQLMREANNKAILAEQRRQDFDVIFLFAQSSDARVIVPLLRYYYVNDVPVYASASVYTGKLNAGNANDLNGVTICDIPWGRQANPATQGQTSNRLFAVGQDAYTLSQALPTLAALPHFSLYGKTGALVLSNNQQIHRRVPCRVIRHGTI